MGHLSNPIGFRLNFEKKWNFNFFVKNIYYPEVVNTLINLRDYLYYYLTRKKILQSGLCLSHFMIYKYLKRYYIKIYVYHIDLEKTAYDLINKLYYQYYEAYNSITCKFSKNKTEKQTQLYHFLRDISNSDVFLVIFIYMYFYGKNKPEYSTGLLLNVYNKSKNLKKYANYINFIFMQQLLYFYLLKKKVYKKSNKSLRPFIKYLNLDSYKRTLISKAINTLNKSIKLMRRKIKRVLKTYNKNDKLAKLKGLVLYKAKKLITNKSNILYYRILKKCNYLKKRILKPAQLKIIKLAWYLTQETIKNKIKKMRSCKHSIMKLKEYEILQSSLSKFKFNYKNWSWLNFYNSKLYRMLHKNRKNKIRKIRIKKFLKLKKILFDKAFKKIFYKMLINNVKYTNTKFYKEKNSKVDFITLFTYLCKKTGFKKVRNTHDLWKKWTVICDYIYLFNKCNLLYVKSRFNINHFFFLIKTAILFSKTGKSLEYNNNHYNPLKKRGKYFYYFNLKHYIFFSLQNGIYYMFFRKTLCLMNLFIKIYLAIIHNDGSLNKIKPENITFTYYFIGNHNVTAQFLARYIVLKLKKGFTVVKTLNPLKRELKRVSRRSKWRKIPYFNYLVNFVKLQKDYIKKYNLKIEKYKQSCYTFFDNLFFKFYNDNNIIIIPNLFLFYLKNKIRIRKSESNYSKTWCANMRGLFVNSIQLKDVLNNVRNSLWLFLLSIFRFYENKKKLYRYYNKGLKNNLLSNYKKAQKLNKIDFILSLISKKDVINSNFKNEVTILSNNFYFIQNIFNNWIWYNKKKKINNFKIEFSSFFNLHYINYVMLKTLWNIFNKLNLRNERDLYIPKYNRFLIGFKLILKGRFSRKQRASKVTMIIGKVPLNTLKFNIEYAFATIPLKNSAISLKFYLCKNNALTIFKRKITI